MPWQSPQDRDCACHCTLIHTQRVVPHLPLAEQSGEPYMTVVNVRASFMVKEEGTACLGHASSMPQREVPRTLTSRDRTLLGSSSSRVKMSPRFTVS